MVRVYEKNIYKGVRYEFVDSEKFAKFFYENYGFGKIRALQSPKGKKITTNQCMLASFYDDGKIKELFPLKWYSRCRNGRDVTPYSLREHWHLIQQDSQKITNPKKLSNSHMSKNSKAKVVEKQEENLQLKWWIHNKDRIHVLLNNIISSYLEKPENEGKELKFVIVLAKNLPEDKSYWPFIAEKILLMSTGFTSYVINDEFIKFKGAFRK